MIFNDVSLSPRKKTLVNNVVIDYLHGGINHFSIELHKDSISIAITEGFPNRQKVSITTLLIRGGLLTAFDGSETSSGRAIT
jgi:hypothetical protein